MAQPRMFVIVDFSLFRGDWRFFAVRGISEARRTAKRWVAKHPCGMATVVSPEDFRRYWSENFRSLYFLAPNHPSRAAEHVRSFDGVPA